MAPNFFRFLLACTAIYALLRGGRDERCAAAICVVGTVMTHLALSPVTHRYSGLEEPVMIVDIVVFVAFVVVALRSCAFWPLWIAGLQLTTVFGHLVKWFDRGLFPRAYGAALVIWIYPILFILLVATWRGSRRAEAL
jgi:hypothetical protein